MDSPTYPDERYGKIVNLDVMGCITMRTEIIITNAGMRSLLASECIPIPKGSDVLLLQIVGSLPKFNDERTQQP